MYWMACITQWNISGGLLAQMGGEYRKNKCDSLAIFEIEIRIHILGKLSKSCLLAGSAIILKIKQ